MTRVAGEFTAALPPHEAIVACAEAVEGLGWYVEDIGAGRVAARARTASGDPFRIEMQLVDRGAATEIRVAGGDLEVKPLAEDVLIGELNRLRAAVEAAAARGTPEAATAPAGRPARAASGRSRERIAILAIVGLVAIGVVVAAIAILGGSSDEPSPGPSPRVHRPAKKSSGKSKPAPSKDKTGSEPVPAQPPSSTSELGQAKQVRDADQRFTLTPTSVQRQGSFITVGVKVAADGGSGYDPPGGGFQAILIGSDGQAYRVKTSGAPAGCKPPSKLRPGETGDGCAPFEIPDGVEAATLRYVGFFVGSHPVQWQLA
jgi:hypothetical protein